MAIHLWQHTAHAVGETNGTGMVSSAQLRAVVQTAESAGLETDGVALGHFVPPRAAMIAAVSRAGVDQDERPHVIRMRQCELERQVAAE